MTGKWHLGKAPDKIPAARGFERDFSLLDGGGNYWDMTNVPEDLRMDGIKISLVYGWHKLVEGIGRLGDGE